MPKNGSPWKLCLGFWSCLFAVCVSALNGDHPFGQWSLTSDRPLLCAHNMETRCAYSAITLGMCSINRITNSRRDENNSRGKKDKTKRQKKRWFDVQKKMRDQQNNGIRWFSFSSLIIIVVWFTRDVALCVCECAMRRSSFHSFFSRIHCLKKNNNKKQQYWRVHQRRFQSSAVSVVCSQLVVCVDSILISFVVVSMSLAIRIDIWKIGRAVFTNFTVWSAYRSTTSIASQASSTNSSGKRDRKRQIVRRFLSKWKKTEVCVSRAEYCTQRNNNVYGIFGLYICVCFYSPCCGCALERQILCERNKPLEDMRMAKL